MDVYVEPYLPRPELHLIGHGRIAEVLAELAHLMHFMVTVNDPAAVRERFPKADRLINSDPDFKQLEVGPNTFVVVVTQHKGDQHSIKKALREMDLTSVWWPVPNVPNWCFNTCLMKESPSPN